MSLKDYPEAYQKGYILFCDLEIEVNQNVLIPRIETEKIVDIVERESREGDKILEIGTGSGCISIALEKRLTNIDITATDISDKALTTARENAKKHHVENKITFLQSDLLDNITNPYDIIVSNLPYIPTEYIQQLDTSVKDFEPHLALDGGKDGFALYRNLFKQIVEKNINPKFVVIELDDTHHEIALEEGTKYFPRCKVAIEKDKYGYNRFLTIAKL